MKSNIQAVFFDAGYTLLCMDPDQRTLFLRACAQLDIEIVEERFAEAVARANALLAPRKPGAVPRPFSQEAVDGFWTTYNHTLLSCCARRPEDAAKAGLVYRRFTDAIGWRIYDEVRPVLGRLRTSGIRLGVISNWTGDLEDVLRACGLHQEFDFILDSARLGHEKPHREIFREALQRAGVACGSALHVGDSPEHDVEGALGCELGALLLDRTNRYAGFSRAPRIASLDGLFEHV
jgi:putative hydrolase of the HAD superfamily